MKTLRYPTVTGNLNQTMKPRASFMLFVMKQILVMILGLLLVGCGGASVAARAAAKAAKIAGKVPESPKPKVIKPEAETGNHNAGKVVIDVGAEMAHEPLNDDSVPLDD